MEEQKRREILIKAKSFFQKNIIKNHIKNTLKLTNIKEFRINPFTLKYLACFAYGDSAPENMAKALLYPRILGTSISTSFGTQLQYFCNDVLYSYASTTSGIDIEFIDYMDSRKKYCQVKSGPNCVNHDGVTTIVNHFGGIKNLARVNKIKDFNPMYDCIVGVFYGTPDELNTHYNNIIKKHNYPVYVGQEFWYRLTGDKNFYYDLINVFAGITSDEDNRVLIDKVLEDLTEEIKNMGI